MTICLTGFIGMNKNIKEPGAAARSYILSKELARIAIRVLAAAGSLTGKEPLQAIFRIDQGHGNLAERGRLSRYGREFPGGGYRSCGPAAPASQNVRV